MRGLSGRVATNIGWIVIVSVLIVVGAAIRFVGPPVLGDTYRVTVTVPEGGGILPGMPVTVLGTDIGVIADTRVTREAVDVELEFERGVDVPATVLLQVLRRSPIGEQAIELTPVPPDWDPPPDVVPSKAPVASDWQAARPGSTLEPVAIVTPSSVPELLDKAERLLDALPADDLSVVVDELATALEGRVETVRTLGRDTAALSETLAEGIPAADRLLAASDDLLSSIRDQRRTLAASIADSADVVETLAAARPDAERLLADAGPTLEAVDELVRDQRPNLSCLNDDLLALGELTGRPDNLRNLERILDLNRFFYGGFDAGTQWDPFRPGVIWARVNILLSEEAGGQPKIPPTPTPPTLPGAACTSPFGVGVDAVRQHDPVPPDETSPGILYAPLVAGGDGSDADRDAGVTPDPPDRGVPLPATGGGTLPALGSVMLGLWLLRRLRAEREPRHDDSGSRSDMGAGADADRTATVSATARTPVSAPEKEQT